MSEAPSTPFVAALPVFNEAQQLAIGLEGRDLLVAAGAGTGKTTVLVERVLRKLREGVDLGSLLVVTFTDKAAAEMKERIYRAMSRDPRLRRLLPLLPRAGISTIHAFCARLLREHFLLSGVDAGFRVLDENGAREAMEEALRRTFHDWYVRGGDEGRVFQELVELAGFGENGEELREIVRRLHAFARSTADPGAYLARLAERADPRVIEETPWGEDWVRAFSREWRHGLTLYDELVQLAERSGVNAQAQRTLVQALHGFDAQAIRDERGRTSFLETLRNLELLAADGGFALVFPRAPKGANQIPGWESLHKYAKQTFDNSRMLRWLQVTNELLLDEERYQNRSLRVLVSLVEETDVLYARYKNRSGFLDYSDLEVRTAQLLREHGSSLALQDRFSEVLVDEYQDVNPLQESILSAISKPGRRFRVGDVKQSIYRFRLADPRIFLRHIAGSEVLSVVESITVGANRASAMATAADCMPAPGVESTAATVAESDATTAGVDSAVAASGESNAASSSVATRAARERREVASSSNQLAFDLRPVAPGNDLTTAAAATTVSSARSAEAGVVPTGGRSAEAGVVPSARSAGAGVVPSAPCPGVIYLNDNHRSRPEILHFVNHVFETVFDEATIGSRYVEQSLVPKREPSEVPHPVELYWIHLNANREGDAGRAAPAETEIDLRVLQPRVVARRLRNLATDAVLRGENGECDWSRVVILLRARTAAARYLDALNREGIPCFLGEGGSLLEEPAPRDLLNLLRVIDNPRDDIAVAAVLRSPLFAFADSDLLRIRLAFPAARTYLDAAIGAALLGQSDSSPAWVDSFVPPDGDPLHSSWIGPPRATAADIVPAALRSRLDTAFVRLATWRVRAEVVELGRLLVDLLEETHLHSLTAGDPKQDACLEKLVALARAYDAERGPSLRGFLARLDALEGAGGIDSVPEQPKAHGVRVLTIHRAKGLEFPVVVLPELGWRFYGKDHLASRIRIGPDYVGLRRFDAEQHLRIDSIGRSVLEQIQEDERREEEARVLYVAFTRARERLILVGASPRRLGGIETQASRRVRGERAFEYLQWIENALPWEESCRVPSVPLAGRAEDVEDGLESTVFPSLSLIVTQIPKQWIANLPSSGDPVRAGTLETASWNVATASLEVSASSNASTTSSLLLDAELWKRIARVPPRPPLSLLPKLRGKYWVTELGRIDDVAWFQELRESATTIGIPGEEPWIDRKEQGEVAAAEEEPSEIGIRYHMALSRVDLSTLAPSVEGGGDPPPELSSRVERALSQVTLEPWWGAAVREPRLETGLVRFLGSSLGRRLLHATKEGRVEREVAFSLRWPVKDLLDLRPDLVSFETLDPRWDQATWKAALDDAWVLIQGRIDCVFEETDAGRNWVVLDWKTDRVKEDRASHHARRYRTQMQIYAEAARRLWGASVETHLVYLWLGTSVEMR